MDLESLVGRYDAGEISRRELLGMPVLTPQASGFNLRVGGSFLGLYPAAEGKPAEINHFCVGIEHFDAEATRKKLVNQGLDASINQRGDTKELYLSDPMEFVYRFRTCDTAAASVH